jgi:hypothetical protein
MTAEFGSKRPTDTRQNEQANNLQPGRQLEAGPDLPNQQNYAPLA